MATAAVRRDGHGSVKSLGGVSIFQDPDAGSTLPRDVEMTLTMYDSIQADEVSFNPPANTTSEKTKVTKFKSGKEQKKRKLKTLSNGHTNDVNNSPNDRDQNNDRGSYTFTFSQTDAGSGLDTQSNESSTLPKRNSSDDNRKRHKTTKTGSFQMKTSYGYAEVKQASVSSTNVGGSQTSTTKIDHANGTDTVALVQENGYHLDVESNATSENHFESENGKISSQGHLIDHDINITNEIPSSKEKQHIQRQDSDLTSVSSLISSQFGDSNNQTKLNDKKLSQSSANGIIAGPLMTTSQSSLNRSESQRSMSKAPSLNSITENGDVMITDVYNDTMKETSSRKTTASKTTGIKSKTSSPPATQNNDFKDKMNILLNSHNRKAINSSRNSSASSTLTKSGENTSFRADLHLEINSDLNVANTFPVVTTETRSTLVSPIPMSPTQEMQQTIKYGTVGSLVKDKFKNLNLTGRSIDATTLERQRSKVSTDESPHESGTPGDEGKKFKFLIEGIDYPERDTPVDKKLDFENKDEDVAQISPDVDSAHSTKKREVTKRGFSYVLDEKLASAIIKKAADVSTRRPHEALEVKTSSDSSKVEKSEVLVEAKANLKHDDSFSVKHNYKSRTPDQVALLQDIKSRLVVRKEVKQVTTSTEATAVDMYAATTQQESIVSSMSTLSSNTSTMQSNSTVKSIQDLQNYDNNNIHVTDDDQVTYNGNSYDLLSQIETSQNYSTVLTTNSKRPQGSKESQHITPTTDISVQKRLSSNLQGPESFVDYSKSPEEEVTQQSTVSLERNIRNINEQFKQHQGNTVSLAIKTEKPVVHANTEIKSLRDVNRFTSDNAIYTDSDQLQQTKRPEIKVYTTSNAYSLEQPFVQTGEQSIDFRANKRSSLSSDSTQSQYNTIHDSSIEGDNVIDEDEIVPLKKDHVKQNLQSINVVFKKPESTRNNEIENQSKNENMMDSISKSNGTEVKASLNMLPPRHVSHKDLVDENTKESSKIYVTTERPIKSSVGRYSNELYVEVNDRDKYITQTQGGINNIHTNFSKRGTQETFYQGGQVLQPSSDVTVQRVKNSRGQLYTTVNTSKYTEPMLSNNNGKNKSLNGDGSALYIRQTPQISPLPSPHYAGSESTHNSTSSGAVSSPGYTGDLFYQPSHKSTDQPKFKHISRSSSTTGSLLSQSRSDIYVYRANPKKGRTLSDINRQNEGVIHLKPLKADQRHKELKTHPTFYTPNHHTMTNSAAPVLVTDYSHFETSNINATSTLRPNTDTGLIHIMDNNNVHSGKSKPIHDENMNYPSLSPASPRNRVLTANETPRGRIPVRQHGMNISRVNVESNIAGYDSNDGLSVYSEPTIKNNPYKFRKAVGNPRVNSGLLTPADIHQDLAVKKQKLYQVTRNMPVTAPQPSVEVELDPHLQEAHKKGDNYNVTMKLNASLIGNGIAGTSASDDLYREEYVEESLYKNNNSMRGPPPQLSPRGHSSSYSDDIPMLSPGSVSKTNITLINDYQSQSPTTVKSANVEHLRFKHFVDGPPQLNVSSTRNDMQPPSINEPALRPNNNNVLERSPRKFNKNNNAPPKFSMSIDQTMTMDYVPSDQENDNSTSSTKRQPANLAPNLERQKYVPTQQSMQPPVQKYNNEPDSMEYNRMVQNGDIYNNQPYDEDDLENYLSPAEEEDISPSRAPKNQAAGYGYPQVVRGSILIKNAIDTTGAPKVIDVVEGASDSDDDDPLVDDNVNPFDGQYFQARENPMYSSDPDLRIKKEKSNKPEFASRLFSGQPKKSRFDPYENEDYDTEIPVTRGSNANKPPRIKNSQKSENTSYVYNGYDHPDRGSSSRTKSSVSHALNQQSSTELDIQRLLKNAPPNSIKQTINVEREEEEIFGPLPNGDDGTGPDSLLNFDTISEKVDLGMKDGGAQVSVKVRCERIVPIRGVEDMFKKSSVIVTRLIDINLMVTNERKKLYEHITNKNRNMITSGDGKSRSKSSNQQKLSTKETFKLYKTFMGMAEADDESKKSDNLRIDRSIEEQNRPQVQASANFMDMDNGVIGDGYEHDTDALDRQLEEQLIRHAMRAPEPDTISYMSVASESGDILY